MFESPKMTDKELDNAISNHMRNLSDLEIIDNTDRKTKLNSRELSDNPNDLYFMDYTGDWNKNPRSPPDELLNLSTGNSEWKSKTPYSVSNPSHSPKCNYYTNLCPDDIKQKKRFKSSNELNEGKLSVLSIMRRHLANYQEKQGISMVDYPFSALIKIMGHITGTSLLALLYIIINIAPMAQIFLFITRFILDKIINIQKTKDRSQIILKTIFLLFQLAFVYISLTFIIGLIWMPILNMILRIISCCIIDRTSDQ